MYTILVYMTEIAMAGRTVILMLNQQQLALLDRTIAKGAAPDRIALIRRAIREQGAKAQGANP